MEKLVFFKARRWLYNIWPICRWAANALSFSHNAQAPYKTWPFLTNASIMLYNDFLHSLSSHSQTRSFFFSLRSHFDTTLSSTKKIVSKFFESVWSKAIKLCSPVVEMEKYQNRVEKIVFQRSSRVSWAPNPHREGREKLDPCVIILSENYIFIYITYTSNRQTFT